MPPPPPPIVVSGTPVQLGALTGGGWDGSQEPVGGTFVVGVNGDVLVGDGYTSNILQITPSGTDTVLAAGIGASNAALDSYGNLYFGGNYNANVYKIPYNATTGQYVGFTTAPTANCLGGNMDTAACIFAPAVSSLLGSIAGGGAAGYAGVAFDAQGNFFFETNTLPATDPNAIYECNVACIASATATPTLIYADANPVGALAIDPWGNIFFVDGDNSTGKVTALNELPLSSGSYATSPTVVVSYKNAAGYGNGISGLAASGTGTLFISVNGDGLFAIPNTQSGGPDVNGMYIVSTQGGKGVALDSKGNLYGIPYNGGDVVSFIPVGKVALGASAVGTAATAVMATVFDSAAACTPTLAVSVTEFGKSSSEFTASAGATCSTAFGGANGLFSTGPLTAAGFSSFPVTANFTPTAVGERSAALTIKDSADNASGTVALMGVGQNPQGTLDPGIWSSYGSGFTTPYAVSADGAGDMAIADFAGAVYWIPAGSASGTAPTAIGSGFGKPSAVAFDANGNLYIADYENNDIVEIPDVSGALAPASQFTAISSSVIFAGAALDEPSGLGVGPDGTLYISDFGNSRVVFWNPYTGQSGVAVSGLKDPWGVAVDSSNNVYVADTGNGNVLVDWASGVSTTLTAAGVTKPWGVAVDASGSLLVSDKATGNIVRVPNESGTLTVADALPIEKNPDSALGIALDALGDLYTTDSTGASVYAIQRTAASVNFGTIVDGTSSDPATIYLENAGNETATLGTPAITLPGNDLFTLAAGSTDACTSGTTGAPGAACQMTAVFSPITGTPAGAISTTGAVNFSPSGSATINLSGYAATSSLTPQVITGFAPPATLDVGQQTTLSASGGGSGNPVVFSIDPASGCPDCATISGTTLTAVGAGSIEVDANQAGNTTYAAAAPVKVTIAISSPTAAGVPGLLMNQQTWLAALPAGGVFAQDSQAGTSFGVNQQGNVLMGTAYGGTVALFNTTSGKWTTLGSYGKYNNTGGVALDSAGNLYLGALYSNIIAKIPYNNGAYSAVTDATSGTPPANCTGSDTAECVMAPVAATGGIGGVSAMTFDAAGDLFIGTDDQGNNPWSIWECTAACLSSGSPAPVMLYQEPAGNNSSTTVGQYYTGALAVDPWGNLFFTDSLLFDQSSNASKSSMSDLYELPTSTGAGYAGVTTGYAAAPTLLQTFSDTTPAGYDDELDAVVATTNGTVYYSTQYDGVFGIPNTQAGGPVIADQFVVAGQGVKDMELDAHGNLFYAAYYSGTGGDTLGEIQVSNLVAPVAQLDGAATSASFNVVDNAFGCGKTATLAFTSTNSEFSATGGTTCSSIAVSSGNGTLKTALSAASGYTGTLSFSATSGGPQTGTLSAADTANGGTGSAAVSGVGQETPQVITFTAPTTMTYTYAPGLTIPVAASGGASGNTVTFSIDSSSSGAGTIASGVLTVTTAGTIVVDANQAGGLVNGIYYSAATQTQLTLTINPAAQTITFTAPATPVTYTSGLTITLSATSTSDNTVVFTVDSASSGAGTISGGTLTVTQAGNVIIDANDPATADYLAAPQVQQTVVVNQAAQAITFTPPAQNIYFIVGGITVPIVASGGASGNAVVFTLDKSSTGTGTITGSTLNVGSAGNFVIDANQAGTANYTAAPQAQETIVIGTPLPTQTITFNNPGTQVVGTPLTLAATATSGFAVSFASSTSSVCTVSGAAATFVASGTCTITATQPGDNATFAAAPAVTQSFTVNAKGQAPGISLSFTLPSMTIQAGTVGLTQLTVTASNNFAGPVSFACSGLPSGSTCTFNPATVMVQQTTATAAATATTTLSVSSGGSAAAALHRDTRPLFPAATLAIALCLLGFKKRNRLQLLLLLVIGLAGLGVLSGCGGSSSSSTTKATTTTVTVTATSGAAGAEAGVKQTATFAVTIE
ncbi:MAG: hypothetical protein WBE72_23350 [Terracidiphilus sp.]